VSKGIKVTEVQISDDGIRKNEISKFIAKIEEVFDRDQTILEKLDSKH